MKIQDIRSQMNPKTTLNRHSRNENTARTVAAFLLTLPLIVSAQLVSNIGEVAGQTPVVGNLSGTVLTQASHPDPIAKTITSPSRDVMVLFAQCP